MDCVIEYKNNGTLKLKKSCVLLIVIVSVIFFSGCGNKLYFSVCPAELSSDMKKEDDFGKQGEILAHSDYLVIAVGENSEGKITPLQHYKFKHDAFLFEEKIKARFVSYEEPLNVSAIIITDKPKNSIGLIIKKMMDKYWRLYWIKDEEFNSASETHGVKMIYLPPYETMPLLKDSKK